MLHVLPHAGGGGDTYVDVLGAMGGYRFTRLYITPKRKPGVGELVSRVFDLRRVFRGYDLLHIHGEGAAAMFLPLLAARRSITLHGLHLVRPRHRRSPQRAELNLRAIIRAASRHDLRLGRRARGAAARSRGAMPRTVVVHNGVQVMAPDRRSRSFRVRESWGSDSTPVGIWVGSLDERRDPLSVVRAAERTSTTVVFVGDGPLRAEVERAAGAGVRVLGQRQDVPRLLGAADFFVLDVGTRGILLRDPRSDGSRASGAGRRMPENVEAVGDSASPSPTGMSEAIAAAFQQLGDPEVRADLGARARGRVLDLFSAEEMIARTRAVYDEVLASV